MESSYLDITFFFLIFLDEGWTPDEDFIIFVVGAVVGGILIVGLIIGITVKLRRNRRTSKGNNKLDFTTLV